MKKEKTKLLSLVVPVYKKEKTIKEDIEEIDETLKEGLRDGYDYEIICVVDGTIDNSEQEIKKVKSKKVRVFSYKENKGKGYAVRYGMKQANGDLISFLDAGREIGPKGIMMLMDHMEWYNADIIVGSKRHPVSQVNYPFTRRIFSVGYHLGTKLLFGINVTDTQSGLKIFKKKVIDAILPRLLVKRYAMDIEMLAVANYLGFKRIYDAPIEIRYHFEDLTHASTFRSILRMMWDTVAVFYRLKILHYYDTSNKKNWIGEF